MEAQPLAQLKLEHLTTEDGLSQSSGQAILHDSFGYMWFGTQDGLNKYNGFNFTIYKHNPQDSTTISGSHISQLYEDSRQNLWIGTSGAGLNLFDREKEIFSHYKASTEDPSGSISDNAITAILEDSEGNFWIGTRDGLNLLDRDTKRFIHIFSNSSEPGSLSDNEVTSLYEDSRGNLWVGTMDGLNLLDRSSGIFRQFSHDKYDPYSISHHSITVIYEDTQNNFWIGTSAGGLNLFDRDKGTFNRYLYDDEDPHSISGNSILSILEDSRGILWVGAENGGLNVFDRESEKFYRYKSDVRNPHSILHNSVFTMYENRDNILWFGAFSGGISYLDRKEPLFEHYSHDLFSPKPLSNNSVLSFLETGGGNFLVGTDGGGLNVFDRESHEFTQFSHNPDDELSLSSDVILAFHQDQFGYIWIGHYDGGVTRYDPATGTVEHFMYTPNDPYGLSNNHVYVIYEDSDENIWFGTNGGGINKLDRESGRIDQLNNNENIINVVRAIHEDKEGGLWVGTYGRGLIQVDKQDGSVIRQFTEESDGLSSNVIMAIHEDRKGNFWVGTREGGIHLFDNETGTFRSWSEEQGLPSPAILGILEDDHGNLWLSTLNGLSKFVPETETFENYNVEHGIQDREFNPLSFYKDREGYMYFGGVNGFNRFHPDRVVTDEAVPPVVLTDFKIFNQSVGIGEDSPLKKHISLTDKIVLPHTASVLTLDYATLNFNKNKGNQFAYLLEGFDSDWNYVGSRRSATYTNLNPGEYTFRIKAANNYGIWSESDQTLAVIITPPFWQTAWFYLLVIFGVLGIIGSGLHWRVQSITKQNRRLEEEVKRQTADLFNKNVELKKTRSELVEKAHKAGMADLATNVLHNVGNILNSVNVSVAVINETLKRTKLESLKQANQLVRENAKNLENFIINDPKGQKLLHYYVKLEEPLNREQEEIAEQASRLEENMKLMIDVVTAQQSYSNAGRIFEHFSPEELIKDTMVLQSATIERHGLNLVTDYQGVEDIYVEKSKVVHILVNLFKNAKESMSEIEPNKRKLVLKTFQDEEYVYLSINDNGCGIPKEDLKKIFNHGYTTKSYGHGFGLHSCANYMKELKGEIRVESEGPGRGATVTLCFPRDVQKKEKPKARISNRVVELADPELK